MIDYKNKKTWIKYLTMAGVIVIVSPIIIGLLEGIFSFEHVWIQFVAILLSVGLSDYALDRFMK